MMFEGTWLKTPQPNQFFSRFGENYADGGFVHYKGWQEGRIYSKENSCRRFIDFRNFGSPTE
jgi:hypothetical protein